MNRIFCRNWCRLGSSHRTDKGKEENNKQKNQENRIKNFPNQIRNFGLSNGQAKNDYEKDPRINQ